MIENLLKGFENFGSKQNLLTVLKLLNQPAVSLPIQDFYTIGVPKRSIDLLLCLGIVKENEGRIALTDAASGQQATLLILSSLFKALKDGHLLHKFLNERSVRYYRDEKKIFINNSCIPLSFAAARNLLLSFEIFLRDNLTKYYFYVHPDFEEWFRSEVIPSIEASRIASNSLTNLIERQRRQEELGRQAEEFVLEYERQKRKNHPKVNNIRIISDLDTRAGYDIESYADDNSLLLDKFIEVKSYTGNLHFYWSENEVKVAKERGNRYCLYLVDRDNISAKDYHPAQIENPHRLFSDADNWSFSNDGYFFEKVRR